MITLGATWLCMSTGGWLLLRASSRKHHTGVTFAVEDSCFGNCHLRSSRPCHGRLQLVGFRVVRPTQLYMPSISPIMKNKDKKITYWAKCMHEGCTRMKTKWTTISEITNHRRTVHVYIFFKKDQYMSTTTQVPWTRDKRGRPANSNTNIRKVVQRSYKLFHICLLYCSNEKKTA